MLIIQFFLSLIGDGLILLANIVDTLGFGERYEARCWRLGRGLVPRHRIGAQRLLLIAAARRLRPSGIIFIASRKLVDACFSACLPLWQWTLQFFKNLDFLLGGLLLVWTEQLFVVFERHRQRLFEFGDRLQRRT